MDPGIEIGLAAEFVAPVPGFQQRFLDRVRSEVGIARDPQAGVVPAHAALAQHGMEAVGLDPGFERGEHRTQTGELRKG
jgi:hypothetical protein